MRRALFTLTLALATAHLTHAQLLDKPNPAADRALRGLHEALRQPPGLSDAARHDAYLSLIGFGNEQTVPLLLERLRIDYGATEPVPPPGKQLGFICTQGHLVDALRSITNTDQGMFYPRWKAWWDTHRNLSMLQWILEGFREGGLHVIDPPDEQFAFELIQELTDERLYYSINAFRLLRRAPASARTAWVGSAATSDRRALRLGALRDLEHIDTSAHMELIRRLAADDDQEVRELAGNILKQRSTK
jgi:hypothetical protein